MLIDYVIECFKILITLFLINRLEEMSNDNQRLQLSIEQKNGKIRTLENKYVTELVWY